MVGRKPEGEPKPKIELVANWRGAGKTDRDGARLQTFSAIGKQLDCLNGYDVPDQAAWMSGKTAGYASYKVADNVTSHEAWGVGIYCFFRDAAVKAHSAIEAPSVPGVKFHNLTTIWLDGKPDSEISHIINDLGSRAYRSKPSEANRQTLTEFAIKQK